VSCSGSGIDDVQIRFDISVGHEKNISFHASVSALDRSPLCDSCDLRCKSC
jgi:hypothetical protein